MDQKIYHGNVKPIDFARVLAGHFNRGNLHVQVVGDENRYIVQIGSRRMANSGGQTALSVIFQRADEGVSIQAGRQSWVGIAASLGASALAVIRNPFNLIGRLDDIAQDIEYLQLTEEVWRVIDSVAQNARVSTELSERLRRIVCDFCNTPNAPGQPHCIACGAPLGNVQPRTCRRCGFVVHNRDQSCPNCKTRLHQPGS